MGSDPIDAVGAGVVAVVGEFVADPEEDEDGGGHAGGEAGDVDGVGRALFPHVAEGGFEMVGEHVGWLCTLWSHGMVVLLHGEVLRPPAMADLLQLGGIRAACHGGFVAFYSLLREFTGLALAAMSDR